MYERAQRLLSALSTDLHEREEPIRLGILAAVSGESIFLLGPPGVGKSLIARRLQQAFRGASVFSYLMGRFSTPDEVFGPLSIRKLRDDDRYERATEHYLPTADVVFLDEIWKASPPIQNALLTALNERLYRNGTQEVAIPLKVFIGASNELPEDRQESAAFWDRFLIRLVVKPVQNVQAFHELVQETGDVYRDVVPESDRISEKDLSDLKSRAAQVALPPDVLDLISSIRSRLADGNEEVGQLYVSDRRWKKIANLLRASAALHGRGSVEPLDCAILRNCVWSRTEEVAFVDQVIREELAARAGGQSDHDKLRSRLDSLIEAHRNATTATEDSVEPHPISYRGEYYRVIPEDDEDEEGLALVWRGDLDDLEVGSNRELDLFHYDSSDQLQESERVDVVRSNRWAIDIAGSSYRIETEQVAVAVACEQELTGEQLCRTVTDAESLADEIQARLARTVEEEQALESDAREHLFVPATYVGIVLESVRRNGERLAALELKAREFCRGLDRE